VKKMLMALADKMVRYREIALLTSAILMIALTIIVPVALVVFLVSLDLGKHETREAAPLYEGCKEDEKDCNGNCILKTEPCQTIMLIGDSIYYFSN
jgi:hypothetical protein